ncbi:HD-GYP domain-containing protein [Zhaonella formicivorans]|uniref:HD-GYP domain-containing protein n=1 Tax=Zhaonella formicivorans TaxID=2528593 RepID=UPI0010D22025|nr:HD domain-containing phosphohydrolase [Zhaonella formicivorans]
MLKRPGIAVNCLKIVNELWQHSFDVYYLCTKIISLLPEEFLEHETYELLTAAFFHDIGKSYWPREWFEKPRSLLEKEWPAMCLHPVVGAELLQDIWPEVSGNVLELIKSHHERPGGKGYPSGLKEVKNDILVLAACDVFSACTAARKYRTKTISAELALVEVRKFAPSEVLQALKSVLEQKRENAILEKGW